MPAPLATYQRLTLASLFSTFAHGLLFVATIPLSAHKTSPSNTQISLKLAGAVLSQPSPIRKNPSREIFNEAQASAESDSPFSPIATEDFSSPHKPARVHKVELHYPYEARELGIEGDVVVSAQVTKTGEVREIVLKKGADVRLNEAALDALRQFTFEPAIDGQGNAVDSFFEHTFQFRLK